MPSTVRIFDLSPLAGSLKSHPAQLDDFKENIKNFKENIKSFEENIKNFKENIKNLGAYSHTRHGAWACALLNMLATNWPSGLSLTNAKTTGMNSVRLGYAKFGKIIKKLKENIKVTCRSTWPRTRLASELA